MERAQGENFERFLYKTEWNSQNLPQWKINKNCLKEPCLWFLTKPV